MDLFKKIVVFLQTEKEKNKNNISDTNVEMLKISDNLEKLSLIQKDLEDDIVSGLELGAVDYIIKPFRNRELISRINNAFRFLNKKTRQLFLQDVLIDLDRMQVFYQDKEVVLTTLEYKLLLLLVENANHVVPREVIFDKIWDEAGNFVNDNTLSVYIKRIREKIGKENFIKTIKGIGYRVDSK